MENKKVKQMIASVTGGAWMHALAERPELRHFTDTLCEGLVCVFSQLPRYHRAVSIKASDVAGSDRSFNEAN